MDDKGEIVSSCDVDENLALQIWTKGLSPRLAVFNKNQNKRKLIPLRWLEDPDRKLSIKGKGRGLPIDYLLSDLLPHVQRILSEYAVYTPFRGTHWKFSIALDRVLHTPVSVLNGSEFSMLPEEKRARLWIADLTGGRDKGFFRPFFPLSERERNAFLGLREGTAAPLPTPADFSDPFCMALPFEENRYGIEDLFRTGVIRRLNGASLPRWYRPVRIMAAAMLLGFSFCEEDGSDFSDEIWRALNLGNPLDFRINDPRLKGLPRKFVGYVRHIDVLDRISVRASSDCDKDLQGEGYVRKRRVDFSAGLLGSVDTTVTFFDRDDGMMALGCRPKIRTSRGGNGGLFYASPPQKSQEKQELIYTFPRAAYEAALVHDTFGGPADDYFTVGQLTSAKIFEAWSNGLSSYIAWFTGIS
ncbi:MAG: hypothetical protein LBQ90_00485 [Synergistaceae bacterium]|jgi:hypothetical protein|nr:hypothetical protein [Synergistaceae bacterium]